MTLSLSRRGFPRRPDPSQQLIVFQVLHEWFALPIQIAYKVIPIGQVYGSCQNGSVSLTRYHNQDVLVIDIQRRIFGEKSTPALLPAANSPPRTTGLLERHLLLIHNPQGELIGIPLETPPTLRRVAESAFAPIPPTYLAEGGIRCVSAIVSASEQEPPIFLINPHQLLQPVTALPPA